MRAHRNSFAILLDDDYERAEFLEHLGRAFDALEDKCRTFSDVMTGSEECKYLDALSYFDRVRRQLGGATHV